MISGENWSFCYHSHFQPLSPAHFFGLIFVLDLNPISRCCCCIGCIPTSFILCSSPHTHPSLLFSPRCHLPSILNILPRGVGKTPATDSGFRICTVVTWTAIITDWGFACESLVFCHVERFLSKATFLNRFHCGDTHRKPMPRHQHHTATMVYTLSVNLFVLPHFYKTFILAIISKKKPSVSILLSHSSCLPCYSAL